MNIFLKYITHIPILIILLVSTSFIMTSSHESFAKKKQASSINKKKKKKKRKRKRKQKRKRASQVSPYQHSVNVGTLGLLLGSYSSNYEMLYKGTHGLVAELNYLNIESLISSTQVLNDLAQQYLGVSTLLGHYNLGTSIGYRWHWSQKQQSGFLGVNVAYEYGVSDMEIVQEKVQISHNYLEATLNVGKRWMWDFGLNITLRLGAGVGTYFFTVNQSDDANNNQQALKELENTLTETFLSLPIALDGELSIGYCF